MAKQTRNKSSQRSEPTRNRSQGYSPEGRTGTGSKSGYGQSESERGGFRSEYGRGSEYGGSPGRSEFERGGYGGSPGEFGREPSGGYGRGEFSGGYGPSTGYGRSEGRSYGTNYGADYGETYGSPEGYGRPSFGRGEAGTSWGTGGLGGTQPSGRPGRGMRGRGPKGFQRSDERIREMVSEALEEDDNIDASNIEVIVSRAEVTLSGTVEDRSDKRRAEDLIEDLPGVKEVRNELRVSRGGQESGSQPRPTTRRESEPRPRSNR